MTTPNQDSPIRVLLIDDHKIVAEALTALLEESGEVKVVARVSRTEDIVSAIIEHRPDVAICDLEMPGGDPLDRAAEGIAQVSGTKLLILTAYPTDAHINRAIQMGVGGFLTKHEPAEAVVDGILAVHSGHAIYSDEVRERMTEDKSSTQTELKVLTLTPRELSVVRLVAQGMTTAQIAETIHRSPKTIDNQIGSALSKTNSTNRVELSRWAIREGLVRP
ncbi:MAG: response regulator [Phycisphaerales bacterium]